MIKPALRTLTIAAALTGPICFSLQAQQPDLKREIEREVAGFQQAYHVPGLSVAVVQANHIVLCEGFGLSNPGKKIPFDQHTVGRLASATKFFTCLGMLVAQQKGLIDLNAPLGSYIDGVPTDWRAIPLWQLLNLTSGIPGTEKTPFDTLPVPQQRLVSEHQLFDMLRVLPLDYPPGSKWSYRQTGYMTAAMIVEDKTGKSWPQFLEENILAPNGMTGTAHNDIAIYSEDQAPANYVYNDSGQFVNAPFFFPVVLATGGGYNTTAADMAQLFLAINGGKTLSPGILRDQVFNRERMFLLGDSDFYSIASEIKKFGPYLTLGHTGGPDLASIRYCPDKEIGVAILADRNTTGIAALLTSRILKRMLLDSPFSKQLKPIAFAIRQQAAHTSYEQLLQLYVKAKEGNAYSFDNEEDDLNNAGYEFLNQHNYPAALHIFQLIVHEHPTSANAFDSLGEAFLKAGDKKNALENYKKSLALNPANDNAKKIIQQLQ
ncbi:serine hydrolase [Dinghuibacter silviterrae]|uniref:CubicO group peptidase (Beta-lactamase class C family) n=1 Tax=Dinghuibacter silviterrae TaxID=1539049 RepID=A0A4R8DFW3_9BACT|nr:serine hydrolase [Dinghuibacter silviterrae]TDW96337.1 CubicO group peptidase (beta-lactamase class C family) [Dinghuibacter silviterrae]